MSLKATKDSNDSQTEMEYDVEENVDVEVDGDGEPIENGDESEIDVDEEEKDELWEKAALTQKVVNYFFKTWLVVGYENTSRQCVYCCGDLKHTPRKVSNILINKSNDNFQFFHHDFQFVFTSCYITTEF